MQSSRRDSKFRPRSAITRRTGPFVFREGSVKHVYFIAETKGSMSSLDLRPIEKAKISCAKRLFEKLSNGSVHYDHVDSYEELQKMLSF